MACSIYAHFGDKNSDQRWVQNDQNYLYIDFLAWIWFFLGGFGGQPSSTTSVRAGSGQNHTDRSIDRKYEADFRSYLTWTDVCILSDKALRVDISESPSRLIVAFALAFRFIT